MGSLACTALASGCASPTTAHHHALPLHVHFGFHGDTPERLLSTRVDLGASFSVVGDLARQLTGRVQKRGEELFADLLASTGVQSAGYSGVIQLERPFIPGGGASSGGAGTLWFLVSTNSAWEASLELIKQEYRNLGGVME